MIRHGYSQALRHRLALLLARTTYQTRKSTHQPSSLPRRQADMSGDEPAALPSVSRRIRETDDPVMVTNRRLVGGLKDVLSLGQGATYWTPPASAISAAVAAAHEPDTSAYGADEGLPELRDALRAKLASENGLRNHEVIVTAGANQALVSLMLALLDPGDAAAFFRPFYFNAVMACQMTGCGAEIALGPCTPDWRPDLAWLEQRLADATQPRVRLMYLPNPSNPSGVTLGKEELEALAALTRKHGAWLLLDCAYEPFAFGGARPHNPPGPNVIHVFSFSKSHGLMGWRVGYIAYPSSPHPQDLALQLLKVQDTVPIHAAKLSQLVALHSLEEGRAWVDEKVESLRPNREAALDAVSPLGRLGEGVWGGDAIYLWARLPPGCEADDAAVVRWLAHTHGVAVIPGSGCGCPGHLRIAFGRPAPGAAFGAAAARLKRGLQELVDGGYELVRAWAERNPIGKGSLTEQQY